VPPSRGAKSTELGLDGDESFETLRDEWAPEDFAGAIPQGDLEAVQRKL